MRYMVIVHPIYGYEKILVHTDDYADAQDVYNKCKQGFYSDVPKRARFALVEVESEFNTYNEQNA